MSLSNKDIARARRLWPTYRQTDYLNRHWLKYREFPVGLETEKHLLVQPQLQIYFVNLNHTQHV